MIGHGKNPGFGARAIRCSDPTLRVNHALLPSPRPVLDPLAALVTAGNWYR